MRLLLVEDDPEQARILAEGLREQGMDVDRAATYAAGLERALRGNPEVIVLRNSSARTSDS